jgi:hypothetical protein
MCPRLPSLPCAPSPSWRGPLWDRFLRDELEASWQDRPAWGILRVSRNPSDPRRATIFRHYIRLNIYHKVQGSGIGLIGAAGSQHRASLAAARGAPPVFGAALLSPPCWRTGPPPLSQKCSSQEAQAGSKFHTEWRRGSVQHRFCVGCAPQKLLFVRRRVVLTDYV